MRAIPIIALCLFAASLPAHGAPVFAIRVETERSGTSMAYDPYATHPRRSTLAVSALRYVFHIRATALAPLQADAEWVILSKDADGAVQESTRGQATLQFPKYERRAVIRTATIDLPNTPGSSYGDAIYGYGIRLTDSTGAVLGEKYSPSGARGHIVWTVLPTAPPPAPPPPRPTVPMPVVF